MAQAFDRAWMIAEAREHWKKHLPRLYARLKNRGELEEALRVAADQTLTAMDELVGTGMTPAEAWPEVRAEFLILDPANYDPATAP